MTGVLALRLQKQLPAKPQGTGEVLLQGQRSDPGLEISVHSLSQDPGLGEHVRRPDCI